MSAMRHPFGFVGDDVQPLDRDRLVGIVGHIDGLDALIDAAIDNAAERAAEADRERRRDNRRWLALQACSFAVVVASFGGLIFVFGRLA